MYRTYLRTFDQAVISDSMTYSETHQAAAKAFAVLINRTELDGQKYAAMLTYNHGHLACHRFDHPAGHRENWRGRLHEIDWPTLPGAIDRG